MSSKVILRYRQTEREREREREWLVHTVVESVLHTHSVRASFFFVVAAAVILVDCLVFVLRERQRERESDQCTVLVFHFVTHSARAPLCCCCLPLLCVCVACADAKDIADSNNDQSFHHRSILWWPRSTGREYYRRGTHTTQTSHTHTHYKQLIRAVRFCTSSLSRTHMLPRIWHTHTLCAMCMCWWWWHSFSHAQRHTQGVISLFLCNWIL